MLTDAEFKRVIFEAKMVITALVNDEPCGFKAGEVLLKLNRLVENHNTYIMESWDSEEVISRAMDLGIDLTNDEACVILEIMDRQYDASQGISWDIIDSTIKEIYPEKFLERKSILDEILDSFS
jgi:hypothetical protein